MEDAKQTCVVCGDVINSGSLSFEQRLIDDEDFCRTCWNGIMYEEHDEVPLTHRWPVSA